MPDSSSSKNYLFYLQQSSRLSQWYRRKLLYPRFMAFLHGTILDFGCGIGHFLQFAPGTLGVDTNAHCVEYCCSKGYDVRHIAPTGPLPYSENCFDSILLDNVLEHIPAKEVNIVLSEIRRVLVPEGVVLIGVPGPKGFAHDPDHKVYYDKQKLFAVMETNHFRCQKVFLMPASFSFLGNIMRQFCIYAVFQKTDLGVNR